MTLSLESVCILSRRVCEDLKYNSKKIFATLPIALLLTTPAMSSQSQPATATYEVAARIALATNSPLVILATTQISAIVPGESANDRDIRLVAEAAAKAAAAKKAAKAKLAVQISTATDPADFDQLYQAAGGAYGVDWHILKAIHQIETGCSGSTTRSNPSGATGPMQFLPSTFRNHAVDGNGDGVKSVYNVTDAVYTAAKYLVDCGYPDLKAALWGYNPSSSYYNRVLNIAGTFGFQG